MNVTFTEREALRQMMNYIKEERQRLWEEYVKATNRLAELDKIEGTVEEVKEKPVEDEIVKGVVESMTLTEAIELHNKQRGIKEEPVKETVYNSDMERYKDFDNSKRVVRTPIKRSKYRDVKSISKTAVAILKEAGRPLKTAELIEGLEKRGINVNTPYVLIQQIRTYEPKIERVKFGYYQYRY